MHRVLSFILTLFSCAASAQETTIQFHDLYKPPSVKFTFETPGWYILSAIVFIIVLVVAILQIRKYIKNRYRREALHELENTSLSVSQIFVILKNTAMHAFGREKAGPLFGNEWLTFLDKTGKQVRMTDHRESIGKAIYEGKEIEQETQVNIMSNAKKWIRTHAG